MATRHYPFMGTALSSTYAGTTLDMTPNQIPRGTVARYADGLLTLTTPDGKHWRWDPEAEKYTPCPEPVEPSESI